MITEGEIEEDSGEEDDDDGAGGGAEEEFKVEMFLAKEPANEAAGPAAGRILGICRHG
jgi:hypothetical protein